MVSKKTPTCLLSEAGRPIHISLDEDAWSSAWGQKPSLEWSHALNLLSHRCQLLPSHPY